MTSRPRRDSLDDRWVEGIRQGVERHGYHHEPRFDHQGEDGLGLLAVARRLGSLYVPDSLDPEKPLLVTQPAPDAPAWRPFDRGENIGWHNDFSTRPERPRLSLIWMAAQDPAGAPLGAWRVASITDVITRLESDEDGRRLLRVLRRESFPLGYTGDREPARFRLLEPLTGAPHRESLRFYGRALREGAQCCHGHVPERVEEVIAAVEGAADAVGKTFAASTHALLVLDNLQVLHDRTAQTTRGPGPLRKALLCFVA